METLKNALLAPFSETSAGLTTPAKTAAVYIGIGFLLGVMMK